MRIFFIFSILYFISCCDALAQLGQTKGVLKMLEKGKPDKAEKILDKAIEKNDTLPAVLYAESMLLFDSSYSTFDMDKSYTKLLQSKSGFSKLDEKLMEKHAKIGVDLLTLDKLKKRIEKAAFLRALAQNTERDYIYFLNVFKDTEHDDQVVLNRDSLAFLYASNEDTYESYNKFMNKYPRAKQIPLAKERYERLYFNKSTADGKLESYVKFLDDYPATEYRVDAEKRIFEILTAGNTADSFRKFVTAYPDSYLVSKAKRLSYYLENSQKGLASDSLQNANEFMVHKELIAIYDKGKYGFMSVEGKVIIEPKYNYIDQAYMCEPLTQDYFVTHSYIVARNGTIIFDEAVQKVDELGLGVLKVSTPSGVYALHKSGWKVTATSYNDFKVIGDFIGYRSREKWGLMTLSGLKITDPLFTDISKYGSFYLFNFEERFDVLNLKVLVNSANNTSINVQPLYTDFEFLNNQYIWLKTDLGEVVLDGDLNEVIPYNQQKISSTTNGYLVKREKQIYLLGSDFDTKISSEYLDIRSNKSLAIVRDLSRTKVLSLVSNKVLASADSARLIGDYFGEYFRGDSTFIVFDHDSTHTFINIEQLKLINASNSSQFLTVKAIENNKKWFVYDQNGVFVLEDDYDDISAVGTEYLVVTKGEKKGLYTSNGQRLLDTRYDAIANYNKGYLSFFGDKKFGVIHSDLNVMVNNDYDKNIKPYNSQYLVVEKDDQVGLVDSLGFNTTPLEYDEIAYWNDTTALVKQDYLWKFLDISTNEFIGDPIKSYTYLINHDEIVILALVENRYGLFSNKKGNFIPPTFNDIINIGSISSPVYFAEKHIEEADFYIVIYYNEDGELIRKQVFESDEYALIYCEN